MRSRQLVPRLLLTAMVVSFLTQCGKEGAAARSIADWPLFEDTLRIALEEMARPLAELEAAWAEGPESDLDPGRREDPSLSLLEGRTHDELKLRPPALFLLLAYEEGRLPSPPEGAGFARAPDGERLHLVLTGRISEGLLASLGDLGVEIAHEPSADQVWVWADAGSLRTLIELAEVSEIGTLVFFHLLN